MPTELSAAERTTIESIVEGIGRKDVRRRAALRSGWALLITGGLALPVIAGALDGAITTTTALGRIGVAFALSVFVTVAVGSLMDHYRTQAALHSVERALLAARDAARTTPDPAPDPTDSETLETADR